jgi:hypothetical protein
MKPLKYFTVPSRANQDFFSESIDIWIDRASPEVIYFIG